MKKFLILICLIQSIFFTSVLAQTAKRDTINVRELKQLIQKLSDDVSEIRRDQLNYKIEKDLLKEAYSSSISSINVILAIVLGLFTILGFLGLRDIGRLREKYIND